MICRKCGNVVSQDKLFCTNCGEKIVADENVQSSSGGLFFTPGNLGEAAPVDERENIQEIKGTAGMPVDAAGAVTWTSHSVFEEKKYCFKCGNPIQNNAMFCAACGTPVEGMPLKNEGMMPAPEKKPRKKKGLIIGLSAAMVFVLICAVCAAFLILSNGPMTKIYIAAQNSSSASSYEAEFAVYSDGEREEYYKLALVRSGEDDEVTLVMNIDDGAVAIYNDCMLLNIDGHIFKQSLTDEMRKSLDRQTGDLSDLDIAEYLRQNDYTGAVYDYLEDYLDFDELDNCFKTYVKQLNNRSWLKNNAGYECTRNGKTTTYCFDMDEETVRRFLKTTLETFEPAFRHESDYSDCQDAIAEVDKSLCLEMDVEGKYLTSVTCTVYGRHTQSFVITFNNIDNTEIDTDQLEHWYSIASSLDWLE